MSATSRPSAGDSAQNLRRLARVLALIAVALSLICLGLAVSWKREHRIAECWREAAEEGVAAEGRCGGS